VQHLGKGLGRGPEVKTLARGVIVDGDELAEPRGWEGRKVGLAGDEAAHSADRILDATLLPGRVGITEESLDRQIMQDEMAGELGAVIEGDGLAKWLRHGGE
jgi:hypothetical protein